MRPRLPLVLGLMLLTRTVAADSPDAAKLVADVVSAAGGEGKLLTMFRFNERVVLGDAPPPPLTPVEKGNRESVVQVGGDWWIGTAKRDKDKVRILVWAWSLRILLDPKSQIVPIEDDAIADRPVFGLRVTGSVTEPVDLFFDREKNRLACVDYDDTRHFFSEWKETADGQHYASRAVGFRFTDRAARTLADKQWYQSDIIRLTPLAELPAELKP